MMINMNKIEGKLALFIFKKIIKPYLRFEDKFVLILLPLYRFYDQFTTFLSVVIFREYKRIKNQKLKKLKEKEAHEAFLKKITIETD